jgi:hypothetical protein
MSPDAGQTVRRSASLPARGHQTSVSFLESASIEENRTDSLATKSRRSASPRSCVTGFPAVFVVDQEGIIRKRFSGWSEDSAQELVEQIDWLQGGERRAAAATAAKQTAAAKQTSAGRRRRGKAPPAPPRDRTVSPDEHARQLGVEVLR